MRDFQEKKEEIQNTSKEAKQRKVTIYQKKQLEDLGWSFDLDKEIS